MTLDQHRDLITALFYAYGQMLYVSQDETEPAEVRAQIDAQWPRLKEIIKALRIIGGEEE